MSVDVLQPVAVASAMTPLHEHNNSVTVSERASSSPADSMSFRSCVPSHAGLKADHGNTEQHLRVRNENVGSGPVIERSTEAKKPPSVCSQNSKAPPRRASTRSIRTVLTFRDAPSVIEKQGASRLPVPPPDDPVIARAVESSMDLGRRRTPLSSLNDAAAGSEGVKHHPFRRWVTTLQKRRLAGEQGLTARKERWSLDEFDDDPPARRGLGHKKSASEPSSSAFISAVRSVKWSMVSLGEPSLSSKRGRLHPALSKRHRGRRSYSFSRGSVESTATSVQVFDEASRARVVKRQRILEELVMSEELYVADLKMLVNIYQTLRGTAQMSSKRKMHDIHRNVTEMLSLHEDLLSKIQPFAASATVRGLDVPKQRRKRYFGHVRSQSSDSAARANRNSTVPVVSFLDDGPARGSHEIPSEGLALTEVAGVAAVFQQMMSSFFVYEEYAARYHTMLYDMTFAAKAVPNWEAYERGLEALANTLAPLTHRDRAAKGRKSLTIADLLIKPVQRIARYPLLLSDLTRATPVIDSPDVHGEVEKVLYRLRETASEIDRATQDDYAKDRMQRAWRLQDMLAFPPMISAPFMLRSLGHPILCGALHIAYQNPRAIVGEYMLCALFKTCLMLASAPRPSDVDRNYTAAACISLADLRLEAADGGKGLQCYTAPFTWKVVFESDHQLFEVLCSAGNAEEEGQWRSHLAELSAKASQSLSELPPIAPEQYSHIFMDLKSVGYALGQPGTLARRLSVQRAATIGSRTSLCQVVVRDTTAPRTDSEPTSGNHTRFGRSRSLLSTTGRIPVLCPRRSDRIRIENDMANVWTKETLPYPVMKVAQKESHIRASATSVMRKLSRSSIASTLSKRSHRSTLLADSSDEIPEQEGEPEERQQDRAQSHDICAPPRPASRGQFSIMTQIHHRRSKRSPSRVCGDLMPGKDEGEGVREAPEGGQMSTEQNEKTIKSRWSSPAALLGSFSSEGFKSLFY